MSGPRGKWALVVLLASLASACSGSGSAQSSPSAVPTQSPASEPSAPAWGVLVSALSGNVYTVSLVGIDGTVVSSAQAATPSAVTCSNGVAAVVPPPVSTSNTRVYFMDGMGVVHFLAPNGDTGRATTVPVGPARRSMFAVSPDDKRIAVIVADFTAAGASTSLYVEDLNGGGNRVEPFTDSGVYTLWPTGWGGTSDLVVAKVPACAQRSGPGCCGPLEFHVVDPTTGVRKVLVPEHNAGSYTWVIAGPPSPSGVIGEYMELPQRVEIYEAMAFTWDGKAARGWSIQGFTPAYLSPNGRRIAMTADNNTTFFSVEDSISHTIPGMVACGWIDDQHLLAGGDVQHQPRVADVISGKLVPVAAQGDCAGRIPGIL